MSDPSDPRAVDIAVYGLVNAGKSSLINALAGRPARPVGPTSGTTTEVAAESWSEVEGRLGRYEVRLIDTPGLEEVGDEGRARLAGAAARRAGLILFVTEEDLTASALESLRAMHAWGKPVIVAWNKVDQFDEDAREEVLASLRSRLEGLVDPDLIVPVAAAPLLRERREGAEGRGQVELVRVEPEVAALQARIEAAIAEAEALVDLSAASERVESFVAERERLRADRRRKAERAADETSLGLALALAVNPIPIVDLLTAPTGIAILVRRLASVYEIELDAAAVRGLSTDLVRGGRVVLWGTLLGAGAGGLMKFVPGLGHVAGALTEGACAGLFGHVLGRGLIEYFERGGDWGEAGLVATLDRIAASTDRAAVTRGLVAQLKARLGRA